MLTLLPRGPSVIPDAIGPNIPGCSEAVRPRSGCPSPPGVGRSVARLLADLIEFLCQQRNGISVLRNHSVMIMTGVCSESMR